MPVVTITVSKKLAQNEKETLALETIDAIFDGMKKPKPVVMTIVHDGSCMAFQSDTTKPAAFVNIQCVGPTLSSARKKTVQLLCALLNKYGVEPDRVYVNINDSDLSDWGLNSDILG